MSGSSGRRVGQKVFDWVKISSRIPEEVRPQFNAFRSRHEANKASLNTYSVKPETINWDYYRKNISVAGLVDKFEKGFSGVSVPYPKDTGSAEIQSQQMRTEKQVEEAIIQAKKNVAELEKQLNEIKAQKPFEEMTIDEYLVDKPELRKQVEDDTRNHVWYLGRD